VDVASMAGWVYCDIIWILFDGVRYTVSNTLCHNKCSTNNLVQVANLLCSQANPSNPEQ